MQIQLSDREMYVLEVIDALGGDVRTGEIRSFISHSVVLKKLPELMWKLREYGLIKQYAVGRYAITAHGRAALKTPWDLAAAS
jgi:hypothetical protein